MKKETLEWEEFEDKFGFVDDKNNKYNVFKSYKGIYKNEFDKYYRENKDKKIIILPDFQTGG